MRFFIRRRMRKRAESLQQAARLARNMREDVADPAELDRLSRAESELRAALRADDHARFSKAGEGMEAAIHAVYPPRPHPVIREWVELLAVAAAVAMGFRTFILQPFKIPTGSMQPTLYGIHHQPDTWPSAFRDVLPLRLVRMALTGERPLEIRAETGGRVLVEPRHERVPDWVWHVGNRAYAIPKELKLHVRPGEHVVAGQLLASGVKISGDHIFVNRIVWNFRGPHLGEVMVFSTRGMDPEQIIPDTHYIKRLTGRPLDVLQIVPPILYVNETPGAEIPGINRVASLGLGYEHGYQNGEALPEVHFLRNAQERYRVPAAHYFGMGDNTLNSKDSRYFGPIHEERLLGPAVWVYWPLSRRWGLIR